MEKNYRAELTGVFGDPVEGNPTGVMEEAAYEAMGLNYRYITMKVTPEGFPDAMKAVRALHMKGVNLTMPHKIAVIPYLDELSEAASIIGAVNTVVVRVSGWKEYRDPRCRRCCACHRCRMRSGRCRENNGGQPDRGKGTRTR